MVVAGAEARLQAWRTLSGGRAGEVRNPVGRLFYAHVVIAPPQLEPAPAVQPKQ